MPHRIFNDIDICYTWICVYEERLVITSVRFHHLVRYRPGFLRRPWQVSWSGPLIAVSGSQLWLLLFFVVTRWLTLAALASCSRL